MKKLSALLIFILILSKNSLALNVYIYTTDATCNNPTGTMLANACCGTPPYSYLWSNGATQQDISGLLPGTSLTVTVTDASGATGGYSATVGSQPNLFFPGISFNVGPPCEGMCNGLAYFLEGDLNGVPPYSAFYDGVAFVETTYINPNALVIYDVCWNATGNIYVEDANGCNISFTWQPDNVIPVPEITNVFVTNACTGNNGTAVIESNAVYGYAWYDWLDINGNVVASTFYNNTISGLAPGTYFAKVTSFTADYYNPPSPCSSDAQEFVIVGCSAPASPFTSNIYSTYAKLNWSTNDCAISYRIRYKQAGTSVWNFKNAAGNISFKNISGLIPNSQYLWQVRSKCASNPNMFSAWSGLQSFNTQLRSGKFDDEITLNIYPNPATNQLNITTDHFEISKLQIANTLGQVVLSQNLSTHYSLPTTQIDVSTLPSGVYLLTAFINQQQVTKMFVCLH